MATDHNFRVKNGLEVGGVLIANSSGQLVASSVNGNLKFSDDVQAQFGANADLKIYHDPDNSFILHSNTSGYFKIGAGTKELFLHGNRVDLRSETDNESMVRAFHGGAVELYYDNIKRIETISGGAQITGSLTVTGDINIYGDINTQNVTNLDVQDKVITVGKGQAASNSTGSGLLVSGSNASMLWDNSEDRWEFNKDIHTSGGLEFESGSNRIYGSGDGNHMHFDVPTALIGPSTTTSSNPSLGTSAYRFDGVWSSTGNFSSELLVNGANNNNGNAKLSVDSGITGSQISLNGDQIQLGNSSMNYHMKLHHNASNDGQIMLWNSNLVIGSQGTNTGSATARDIIFKPQISGTAAATEAMRIKGDGNVGIGTDSPNATLEVATSATTNIDVAHFSNSNGAVKAKFHLASNTGDGQLTLYDGNNNADVLISAVGNSYINTGGSVGIGTSSPLQLLHIRMPNLSGGNNGNGLLVADDGAQLKLEVRKGTGGVNADRRIALYEDGGNYPLYLQEEGGNVGIGKFQTTQSNTNGHQNLTPTSLLHLMSHGLVGSGTDVMLRLESYISDYGVDPKKIAIEFKGQDSNNNVNFARIAQATVNDGDYGENNEASSNLIFGMTQSGTFNERMIMTAAGELGIGNLNPQTTLHVQNTSTNSEVMRLTTTGDNPDRHMYFQSDHIYSNGNFHLGDGGYRNLYRGSYHTFHYGSSNSEAMRIQTNGNIGIGTTNPQGKLDVDGDLRVTANIVSNTVYQMLSLGSDRTVDDYGGLNKDYWRINLATPGANTDGGSSAHAYGTLIFSGVTGSNTTYVDRMAITPGGNVGIGTNTPIQKLQVVGNIYANAGDIYLDTTRKLIWGNSQQWIQASNNGQMKFIVNNGERLYIQTDGRIETRIKRHARIDDVGNLGTTIRYYKIATVNKGNSGLTIKGTLANHVESFGTCKFDLAIFGRENNNGANISVTGTIDVSAPNSGVRIVKQSGSGSYIQYDVYLVVPKYCHADVEGTIHGSSQGTGTFIDWHGQNTYVTTAPTGAAIELDSSSLAAGHYQVTDSVISDAILDVPAAPSITSTTVVNETIELVFGQSATTGVDHYEVHSDGATGSDYSLIARIPPEDIASSMSVVDASFDDSGTVAYRVYAVKNGVYSSPATTTRSFSMPSLDVSNMSVVPDTNSYHIQYNLPDTRFLDHVEIYVDAEASNSNLARSGASLIYSGSNPSFKYNISSSDMEKYHQFWVECVSV